ncbi:tyrosine-type recombinase/integrase [Aquirufa ecclesiirivi]|uniref:tyrosine-type recombinase/integrase n=1 Tax=Aquirufa ecclesiirivi TaxID=2715124 RepID=UPI00140AD97F|nr:site-specific integrase [Aquirufa ecclesiirivi]NHC49871.1 site-specific integrase [Aquirufa ecclesiirivi]
MSVTFFIKSKTKEKSSIGVSINYGGMTRIVLTLPNLQVSPKEWENGGMKVTRGKHENFYIQNDLNEFQNKVDRFYREFRRMNESNPTKEDIVTYLKSDTKLEEYFKPKNTILMIPMIWKTIKERETGVELNNGKKYERGTIDNYESMIRAFERFEKFRKKGITNVEIVTREFVLSFENYLTNVEKLRLNTVGDRLKNLKTFISLYSKRGILPQNPFIKFNIKIPKEPSTSIALDKQELQDLYDLHLSDNPHLELVRDQFLVLCWTGLRISDFSQFNSFDRSSQEVITLHNEKTDSEIHIPIFPMAKRILDKYNGRFPRMIKEQKLNESIKVIGKMVPGLNRSIQIKYTKGGEVIKENVKRYQLLVLHCARRTLATMLVTELGIDLSTVCLITGHKSIKTLEIYLKHNNKNALTGVINKVRAMEVSLVY